ncbi:glutamate cyclase domain-containing protein [Variovorax sp. 770b2]|uniref:glutamate cyclase domain-containing protein n=1 Tax=Variovorax sp. 770b2 TaxID=1566271 RepID=UPI0008ED1C02|nr:glutamate cyclase domain-containing protein [Variovorax sp. 770b2]SFQ03820.1 glutamate racemase [Variovorax sp. 770b2]
MGPNVAAAVSKFEKANAPNLAGDPRAAVPQRSRAAGRPEVPEKPAALRVSAGGSRAPRSTGALSLKSPNVDALLHSFVGRGIDKFKAEGATATIAAELDHKKHVMLLTGFSVAPQMPETDGMATAVLGKALDEAGKLVTFVTDKNNRPILLAAMQEIDAEMASYTQVVEFDPAHGAEAEVEANQLLNELKPDAVIAVELPGRSKDVKADGTHVYRNMRGLDISPFNGPVDQVLVEANKRQGVFTAGVGDGGNEAGVTGKGIPQALDGSNMANTVKSDVMLTAWNSNLGAAAIGAAVLQRHGKLDKMPTPDSYVRAMGATMKAGAVDGVTRGRIPNEKIGENNSGVDGFHLETHAGDLRKLMAAIARDVPAGVVHVEKGNPFVISVTDSSDGGMIGAKNLAGFLRYRYNVPAVLVPVLDHANAPYGDHTRANLVVYSGRMQQTALLIADLVVTMCNTQATTLPESLHIPPNAPGDAGAAHREQYIVDLVDATARTVAKSGDKHPVLLCTQFTKDSGAYPKKISEYSGGKVEPGLMACPEWAPLVNGGLHESEKPEDKAYVEKSVRNIVGELKKMRDIGELTSVWLCCTHYPKLTPHIKKELKAQGMGDVQVLDQIESYAKAVKEKLDEIDAEIDRTKRTVTNDQIVVTTATDLNKVKVAAEGILRNRNPDAEKLNVNVLGLKSFGADINVSLLTSILFPQDEGAAGVGSRAEDNAPMAGIRPQTTASSPETAQRLQ